MPVIHADNWRVRDDSLDAVPVDSVAEILAALEVRGDEDTILCCPPGEVERRARIARNATGRADIGLLVLDRVPTRRWIQQQLLALLPPHEYRYAGAFAAAAGAAIQTKVLTSSVAKLTRPTPKLGQHLASWLPWSAFEIDASVGTIAKVKAVAWDLSAAPLVVRAGNGARQKKAAGVRWPQNAYEVSGPDKTGPWSAPSWLEVSVLHATPAQIFEMAHQTLPAVTCPSCGRAIAGNGCLFCGADFEKYRTGRAAVSAHPTQVGKVLV